MNDNTDNLADGAEDISTTPEAESENTGADNTSTTSEDGQESSDGQSEKWFVEGQFKTPDDVLNSYRHLQSAFGRTQSELQAVRKAISDKQTDPKAELEQFAKAVKENPLQAIREEARRATAGELSTLKGARFKDVYESKMKDPEFSRLEPIMGSLTEMYGPYIEAAKIQNDPIVLDMLYYMAQGIDREQQIKQAEQRGAKKGEEIARKKGKAQVEGASGSRGRSTPKNINDLTSEEIEKGIKNGTITV